MLEISKSTQIWIWLKPTKFSIKTEACLEVHLIQFLDISSKAFFISYDTKEKSKSSSKASKFISNNNQNLWPKPRSIKTFRHNSTTSHPPLNCTTSSKSLPLLFLKKKVQAGNKIQATFSRYTISIYHIKQRIECI